MSKASKPASASRKQNEAPETPASFSLKNADGFTASDDNDSKFSPTSDAKMNVQSLGTEDGLMKLLIDSVKDLYWAENHLVKALPKMARAVSGSTLREAILQHLDLTKTHVERLEQVFELLGRKPQAKKCDAMEGLTKEGEGVIEDTDPGTAARELGVIMASQKVEHYEISAYIGLVKLADKLGLADVSGILAQTLAEEQDADTMLGDIADNVSAEDTAEAES